MRSSQVLHYVSDDEWAAEGSDDDLGMKILATTLLAQMKVFITPSYYYKIQ